MQFNKTIATMAVTASTVFGLTPPPAETKTICLEVHEDNNGVMFSGGCDEARNNEQLGKEILANGCAAGQISLRATRYRGQEEFNVKIHNCLPPNVVQL